MQKINRKKQNDLRLSLIVYEIGLISTTVIACFLLLVSLNIPNYLKIKRESTINNQDEHLAQQTLTVTVFFRLRKKKSKTKL